MLKRIFLIILTLLLMGYIFGILVFLQKKNKSQVCPSVKISLNGDDKSKALITEEQILAEINKIDSIPINREFLGYDTQEVEETLIRENALIESCNLYFSLNGDLKIEIDTNYPLFLYCSDKGSYYVTRNGRRIIVSKSLLRAIPLPIVYGHVPSIRQEGTSDKDNSRWDDLIRIVHYVVNHPKWYKFFTDFYIDSSQNLYLSGAVADLFVKIGDDWSRIEAQLLDLELFISKTESKFGYYAFTKLDLTIPGKIIATPRHNYLSNLAKQRFSRIETSEDLIPPEQELMTTFP